MIGLLVECMQMSKSGVFVYFGLCEDLQVEVVCEYYYCFENEVFFLSLCELCGLLCFWVMLVCWIEKCIQEVMIGCIYISGVVEYDDWLDSFVCEQLIVSVIVWCVVLLCVILQVMEEGYLCMDMDLELMFFELYSFMFGLYYDVCFLYLLDVVCFMWVVLEKMIVLYQSESCQWCVICLLGV